MTPMSFISRLIRLPRQLFFFIVMVLRFAKELVIANYQVAKLVLSTSAKLHPGFISIPLEAKSDFEITSFANAITLTPGTISVHIPDNRHCIVIHAIDISGDLDTLRQSIKDSLEAPILRFTR
jgi:multicomponent Na+:H+ antiporter subunit E